MNELFLELSGVGYQADDGNALVSDFAREKNIGSRSKDMIDCVYFMNGRFIRFSGHYDHHDLRRYVTASM